MSPRRPRSVADALAATVALLPAGMGEVRDGQLEMAEAVGATFDRSTGVLAAAAGTGTGKSFAYLVAAALSGKRVLVATATKALQDQLATKDLPLVARALGRLQSDKPLSWAVLKGRSNYLCLQSLDELERIGQQEQLEGISTRASSGRRGGNAGVAGQQVVRLVEWSRRTRSGDRAELDFEPLHQAWASVSVSADQCPGQHRCEHGADCFTEQARAKAGEADIVVINLHLLGAHLRSGGLVLPEFDALVVDEAHELEDVLAASLGVELTPGRLRGLATQARAALVRLLGESGEERAHRAVDSALDAATALELALANAPEARLAEGLGPDVGPAASAASSALERLGSELRRGADPGHSRNEGSDQALRAMLGVDHCREELDRLLSAGADEVVWVQGGDRRSLRSAPLDVSPIMATQVFECVPVVLTSATMAPGIAVRLGAAPEQVTDLDVGSPFDYRGNGLLYCATSLPDRRSKGAEAAIHREIELLIRAAEGRTLALFTSRRAMEEAAAAVRARISWPVHVQGELPKPALLQRFSTEHEACLFATMGFWQGVDIPGPTLSLVVIDRLPFPRPDDPLMLARREAAGASGFRAVDLPRAATLLAQGTGRLIRTGTDRGVVAVLDPRLATASYSGYLVAALPKMRRTRDRDVAVAFLRSLSG